MANVLVVFADGSLGGVARSAQTAGAAWKIAGHKVTFTPLAGIHSDRAAEFTDLGTITALRDVDWSDIDLVHLHHAALSAGTISQIEELLSAVSMAESWPPLLTHNVFGVNDQILDRWPGNRATAVLGEWAADQYRFSRGAWHTIDLPFVVGNAQDTGFFRPPTADERELARQKMQIANGQRVVLRVGSPLPSKWDVRAYLRLATVLAHDGAQLILIGPPPDARVALERAGAIVRAMTSDDRVIRDSYWAADAFALNSARGESFGNVAMEALLSGLPVVYRAREYRDNTPWEFQRFDGFYYERTSAEWLARAASGVLKRPDATSREAMIENYGLEAVARMQSDLYARLATTGGPRRIGRARGDRVIRPNILHQARILARHNQLVSRIRELRVRRLIK
ncbi:glycosyltransferase [Microbacterium ureisolvens]|uniref:glycosyltransferase n=1 Tax=Microbacterium ureisolvens TaxID=2781186 RepID=UPI00362E2AC5